MSGERYVQHFHQRWGLWCEDNRCGRKSVWILRKHTGHLSGYRWGEEKRKRVTQIRRWEYILARDNLHKLQNMQTRKLGGRNIFSQEVGIYSHKRQHAQVAKYSYIARIYTHEFKVESLGDNVFTYLLEEGLCLEVCVQDEFMFAKPIWHGAMFICHWEAVYCKEPECAET